MKRRPPSADDSIDREIAFHIDELTHRFIEEGVPPGEARRRALLEFGGREQVKQSLREVQTWPFAEHLFFHLQAAIRFIRKAPGFSVAVGLTLAFAIGANSAVFSAIDAIIFRALPFPESDQLLVLSQRNTQGRDTNPFVAPVRLEEWNQLNSTLQAVSGYYTDDLSETSGPLPEKVTEALVAPRFLQVMGVSPALGRGFTTGEEHWGGPNAALISYAFWQRRFNGDPNTVGKKLHVDKYSYTIVGIMPASFQFPSRDVDVWCTSAPDAPFAQRRDATWFTVIGRMKPGVTIQKATADLRAVQSELGKQFPKPDSQFTVDAVALKETVVGSIRDSLWLLYGSVTLLLLIACSNIAALLLARTAQREQEISIRYSLGASRTTIMVQIFSEVFGLALLGSMAGLLVAAVAARGFHRLADTLPRATEITLNWKIVGYSLLVAGLTTILCGLIPAVRGTRRGLASSLAHNSRTQVSVRNRLQWTLVGVQVAFAVALLLGAGLLLRSMQQIARVSPGFDPSHVLTLQVSGSWAETADKDALSARIRRTLDGLRTLPGVEADATSGTLPGASYLYQLEFKVDGKSEPGHPLYADSRYVSGGYFETVGIPILLGDPCRLSSKTLEVIVNRTFADRYLNGSPIGHQLSRAEGDFLPTAIIRGVAADAHEEGINKAPVPTVYTCYSAPGPFPNYLIRTHGDPAVLADAVRRRLHELEPSRSVYAVSTLQDHLDNSLAENRLRTLLLTLFAVSAVSLACIGLYGTLSYLARLRRKEVGVRLALGALRSQIVARFLGQGLRVTGCGCLAGLALGFAFSRVLHGMLYGVTAVDPLTYAGVAALVLTIATLALLFPALRASRVQPAKVLRDQ
ncbi:ABC transporter permease [Acidobacteria bacterium AB60]|nr:ABC transporter permease [Acidobacteria bacterium AB60]